MRTYATLPDIPEAGVLHRYAATLGVVVPIARTNLVTNPSFETTTDNWTAVNWNTINRTTVDQWAGVYALEIGDPLTSAPALRYGTTTPLSTTTGVTYAVSLMVKPSHHCTLTGALRNTADTAGLPARAFRLAPNAWQRITFFATETSTTSRIVTWTATFSATDAALLRLYVDAAQVEACGSEGVFATTYIDGDQRGLVPNQFPPAYLWNGTPHASTSTRSGQTRAGGRIMRFTDFTFLLTAIIGLGLATPQHEALAFAQLDGGQYQTTIKPPRTFSLAGRWAADTPSQRDIGAGQLARLLDRDRIGARQPLVLTMQAQDCGVPIGEEVRVQALYTGGLEGETQELPTAAAAITFTTYLPVVLGSQAGALLTPQATVTNANGILTRGPDGEWAALGSGISGGGATVFAIVQGLDGTIYVGGDFTDAGGSGADYIAAYTPSTGTWSVLGSATAINAEVRALAIGPDGRLYVGGAFTNAGGVAAADAVAVWDGSSWAALGSGATGIILALHFWPDGTLYAGGSSTNIGGGGIDYIAAWNGAAWNALASATAINGPVESLAYGNGVLYVGGAFTNAGGVADADNIAVWDGSSWAAMGTGLDSDALALAVGPNGMVYAGGAFTTAGGVSASRVAAWNGSQWTPLGSGMSGTVWTLAVAGDGTLYAGGSFTTAGGLTFSDRLVRWNGAAWTLPDVDLPGSPVVYAIRPTPDGSLYIGYDTAGSATAAATTTVTTRGTAQAAPTLVIRGPSSGSARVYQLTNVTTGAAIYFNYTIMAGETATLTLDPTNISFTSTFQGNILRTILPGSRATEWFLQPGANDISLFVGSSTVTATMEWTITYAGLDDALYQVAP